MSLMCVVFCVLGLLAGKDRMQSYMTSSVSSSETIFECVEFWLCFPPCESVGMAEGRAVASLH